MTNPERILNLKSLGYTEREARFLCLAALASGYFLRRQFISFIGRESGWADEAFLTRLVTNGHAKAEVHRRGRALYHINSRPLFRAIGDENNRNRRAHETLTIKTRLMALDFAAQRNGALFLTESEKVSLFSDQFQIPVEHLPAKYYRSGKTSASTKRFFVDKQPIGMDNALPSFCYIDPGLHSTDGFTSFLQQYRPLFTHLPGFSLVYVADSIRHSAEASRLFSSNYGSGSAAPCNPEAADLLEYFRVKRGIDARDKAVLNQLAAHRQNKLRFATRFDALFDLWKQGGDNAVLAHFAPESAMKPSGPRTFSIHILHENYELLGTALSPEREETTSC